MFLSNYHYCVNRNNRLKCTVTGFFFDCSMYVCFFFVCVIGLLISFGGITVLFILYKWIAQFKRMLIKILQIIMHNITQRPMIICILQRKCIQNWCEKRVLTVVHFKKINHRTGHTEICICFEEWLIVTSDILD